jgi:hypothetical protein
MAGLPTSVAHLARLWPLSTFTILRASGVSFLSESPLNWLPRLSGRASRTIEPVLPDDSFTPEP